MSMTRSIARNIARNRLTDAGYERPNKRMAMTTEGRRGWIDTMLSQRKGRSNSRMARKLGNMLRKEYPQTWKRVLFGDLSKKFDENSKKVSFRRGLANQERKVHRGEAWAKIAGAK